MKESRAILTRRTTVCCFGGNNDIKTEQMIKNRKYEHLHDNFKRKKIQVE